MRNWLLSLCVLFVANSVEAQFNPNVGLQIVEIDRYRDHGTGEQIVKGTPCEIWGIPSKSSAGKDLKPVLLTRSAQFQGATTKAASLEVSSADRKKIEAFKSTGTIFLVVKPDPNIKKLMQTENQSETQH